jgi:hypothetical protein
VGGVETDRLSLVGWGEAAAVAGRSCDRSGLRGAVRVAGRAGDGCWGCDCGGWRAGEFEGVSGQVGWRASVDSYL